jgi:hypothetical protein
MKLPIEYTYDRPEFDYDNKFDVVERIKRSEENLTHLLELEKKCQERFALVGGFICVPVADGQVFYQVVETNEKTATVKRCAGICLDLYEDMILGQGCTLPYDRVAQMVAQRRAMNKLFGRKK